MIFQVLKEWNLTWENFEARMKNFGVANRNPIVMSGH